MRSFHYSIPVTPVIADFLKKAAAVQGKLTGGFQNYICDLIARAQSDRLYLNDEVMGRGYRYSRTYVAGGWQDTHLPPFLAEVERLLRGHQHRREKPDAHLSLFATPPGPGDQD